MGSVKVPLGRSLYRRIYDGGVTMPLINRFMENDPTSTIDDTGLIARPGTTNYKTIGTGLPRGNFSQPGFMGSDLFVVNNRTLYRWDGTTLTTIQGALSDSTTPVSITYQVTPGVSRLWLADGETLWYYEGEAHAQGTLSATGQPSAADVVRMGSVYYKFVASGVDAGSPAGTVSNPWNVLIGTTTADSIAHLSEALDNSGSPGSTYSTALVANPDIETRRLLPAGLIVQAKVAGVAGDSLVTTETSATLSWASGTLTDGGDHFLASVPVPEGGNEKAISITTLAAYVIIAVQGSQIMYLIRPAEFWVELFVSAESEPDQVLQVVTAGQFFYAMGQSTIEPFSATGDADFPMAPVVGRAMKWGIMTGTARVIDNDILFVDNSGVVRNIAGDRLSTHSIEEIIRGSR